MNPKHDAMILGISIILLILAVTLITIGVTIVFGVPVGLIVFGIFCLIFGLFIGSQ